MALQPLGESARNRHATKQTSKSARRGGWPSSRWLEWHDVQDIDDAIHQLIRGGLAPNHLVTIMPLAGDDSARKRACTTKIAHVGQALKRHGHRHVGITIFEHPTDADLHCHHLLDVPRGEEGTVERLHRPPEVDVRPVTDLDGIVEYLTKERRPLPPEFEKSIKRRRVPCLPVPGKRWSMTTGVKELLNYL